MNINILSMTKAMVAIGAMLAPVGASAAVVQAHTANCGGFGTCNDAAFQAAAAGTALEFLEFAGASPNLGGDSFGEISGSSFSPNVTFSSLASGTFGGSNSALVNHESDEIGPDDSWDGILRMDFASAVTAVGFGTVEVSGGLESIRLYSGATLLLDIGAISGALFDYAGFVANAGTSISRVEIEGDFLAIQNLSFGGRAGEPSPVPLPAGGLLLLTALGSGVFIGRKRKKKS